MKKTSLILLMLIILPLANAVTETQVFFIGDSLEISGKNVTLIAIGEDSEEDDILVICINNKGYAVSDEDKIDGVEFTFEDVKSNYAELKIKFPSSGECDDSCSNNLCFAEEETQQEETQQEETQTNLGCTSNLDCNDGNECTTDLCVENDCSHETLQDCGYIIGEEKDNTNLILFSSSLLILVIILLIILIFKKFKKKR